jgi:hypothetical protein
MSSHVITPEGRREVSYVVRVVKVNPEARGIAIELVTTQFLVF